MQKMDLYGHTDVVNELLARYGVKFGIYKNNEFKEQLFPFDAIPRIIGNQEFAYLEKGLKQRVMALNLFIRDIYGDKKIIRDKVVPEEFVYASSGYLAQCDGVAAPKGIHTHIAGIDLVQGKNGEWYILEDNLRVPSGASYPMIARELCRRSSPRTFQEYRIEDNRNYAKMLRKVMDNILAFWGIVDDSIDSQNVRNIIKVGKRIERLDLYGRLHMPREEMLRGVHRLAGRIPQSCLKYRADYLRELERLVEDTEIDYCTIVMKVDNLLEES